mgnify:CR=1 FL=1
MKIPIIAGIAILAIFIVVACMMDHKRDNPNDPLGVGGNILGKYHSEAIS